MPVLVVQMGHSGRTSGATGAPGEMAFTEAVGAACRVLLAGHGWEVRTIPADPPASAYRGDAFVAVHADGSASPAVIGASVGYQSAAGGALAHAWREHYVALGWPGPWHPDNYTLNLAQYYGVRTARSVGNDRACIVECGTITNPTEGALLRSPEGAERAALAIGRAVGIGAPAPTEGGLLSGLTDKQQGEVYDMLAYMVQGRSGHWGQGDQARWESEQWDAVLGRLAAIEDKLGITAPESA